VRHYAWIPAALLLGLLLGSWGPKSEIRHLREDLEEARARSAAPGRTTRIEGVTELLGITADTGAAPPPVASTNPAAPDPPQVAPPPNPPPELARGALTNPVVPSATGATEVAAVAESGGTPPPGLQARIERAAELWRMRSDIARAAFISDAELTDEDAVNFDVLAAAMNLRLANSIEAWVDGIKNGAEPGPEAGIRLARNVTDSLVLTYDEMDRKLTPGWREKLDSPLNLTDFIDPSVASPLTEVEDAVGDSGGWGPGRRRRRERE
jgi:hypothetical protein